MTEDISSPVLSTLKATGTFVDNAFAESARRLKVSSLLNSLGVRKKFGADADHIFFVILVGTVIKAQSMWAFCADFLIHFQLGKKDVIYRFLRREDIPWASLLMKLAVAFKKQHREELSDHDRCALVVDDSLTHRSGKVEGASNLWDHVEKRTVRCQQVLSLGLAFSKGFLPLASHLCTGQKKVQHREKKFKDGRSEVARAFKRGLEETKFTILKKLVTTALRAGIKARWLIGDAGFGTKANIELALDHGMDALFLMKRDKRVYRFRGKDYTAKMLYVLFRRQMRSAAAGRFRSYAFEAEINLNDPKAKEERLVPVQLMLSRPTHNRNGDGWVLSLCTAMDVSVDRMIELYSMRWSVEVFFKESKQSLGHLNNQSGDYVSSYSSIHLSAIRYLLLLDGALNAVESGQMGLAAVRKDLNRKLTLLCYMGLLWELFTSLIFGLLDSMQTKFGAGLIAELKAELGEKLTEFIDQAFHIDINGIETDPSLVSC